MKELMKPSASFNIVPRRKQQCFKFEIINNKLELFNLSANQMNSTNKCLLYHAEPFYRKSIESESRGTTVSLPRHKVLKLNRTN
jgi:hypothetical protein